MGSVSRMDLGVAGARNLSLLDAVTSVSMATSTSMVKIQLAVSLVAATLTAQWKEVYLARLVVSATVCQTWVGRIAVDVCSSSMALVARLVAGHVTQSALMRDAVRQDHRTVW